MPNWCENQITIEASAEVLAEIKKLLKTSKSDFDYNSVIPYPEKFRAADEACEAFMRDAANIPNARLAAPPDGYNNGGY